MHQAAQTAELPGRGTQEQRHLPAVGDERRLVIRLLTRGPIDRVLQHSGDGAVVFRRRDDESIVLAQELLESLRALGQAFRLLQVAVVKRDRKLTEVNQRDFRARGPRRIRRETRQLLVE